MVMHKHVNGDLIDADETNEDNAECLSGIGKNLIRQIGDRSVSFSSDESDWFGDSFTGAGGMLGNVNANETSATYNSTDDAYEPLSEDVYVIIEATDASVSWSSNDCVLDKIDTGKWLLYCDTGTDEVKRAQIIKSLFYGTNGSDALIDDFTSVTALKTSVTRDVGKQAYYAEISGISNDDIENETVSAWYDFTFNDTSTNTACSSWSNVNSVNHVSNPLNSTARWEIPEGTTKNQTTTAGTSSNEIGTDTSGDEVDNPSDAQLYITLTDSGINEGEGQARVLLLCNGSCTITVDENDVPNPGTNLSYQTIDYNTNGIPNFTAVGTTSSEGLNIVTLDIDSGSFSSTISNSFGTVLMKNFESGASIDYKIINSGEDTGWLTLNEISSFTDFTSEPTKIKFRLNPKSVSPTSGYPSFKGGVVRCT